MANKDACRLNIRPRVLTGYGGAAVTVREESIIYKGASPPVGVHEGKGSRDAMVQSPFVGLQHS